MNTTDSDQGEALISDSTGRQLRCPGDSALPIGQVAPLLSPRSGEELEALFDLVAAVGGHSEGEVLKHFHHPRGNAGGATGGFDELVEGSTDVVLPGQSAEQDTRVTVGIGDVTDGPGDRRRSPRER